LPDHKKRPTEQDLTEADDYLQGVWNKAHAEWGDLDNYYHRTFPLWPAAVQDRETYRPSTATNIIDHASNVQLAFHPRIRREPVGDSVAHKEAADRLEVGLSAVLEDCAIHDTSLTWKQAGRHLIHYGYTNIEGPTLSYEGQPVLKDLEDGESDDDYSERKTIYGAQTRDWNPVRIRATHPSQVLMDPLEKQPSLAIKHETFMVGRLHELSLTKKRRLRQYGHELNLTGRGQYDPVDVVHWWTPYWHAVMTDDQKQMLWVEKNAARFVPFSHAFAGFGIVPSGKEFDPVYLAVGLLSPIRDSLKVQAQAASAKVTLLMRAAYTNLGTNKDPFELARQMANEGIVVGDDGDYWLMPTPAMQGWMMEVGREQAQDIEQGSYPKPLGGYREPGVTTVGQQAILSNAGNRTFAGPTRQMEHIATVTTSRVLRLVELLEEPIGVAGRMVKPADIYHTHAIRVTFENLDPAMQLQQRELGIREFQLELKSDETYWEQDARLENISQERERLDNQRVRRHPEVIRLRALEAARRLDVDPDALDASMSEDEETAQRDGRRNGESGSPMGPESAVRDLMQPLTDQVAKPGRL
jgi:hypothetical protein